MRKEEPAAVTASDLLRQDHRRIEAHLDALLEALLHPDVTSVGRVREQFEEIRRLACPHFDREESIFYPYLRARNPRLLATMDAQHEDTRLKEQYLDELLTSLPEPPSERDLVELHRLGIEFHDAVQTHIVDEEDYLLEFADRTLSGSEQQTLFERFLSSSSR